MRKLLLLSAVCLLAACSSTRYQGFFHPRFENTNDALKPSELAMAPIDPQSLTASTNPQVIPTETTPAINTVAVEQLRKTYLQMNKVERKNLRKQIKAEIKSYVKAKKESAPGIKKTQAMDHDLKLSIIFAAVGLVASIIGGDVFWIIGGIAWIIAIVFFVKWLIRQ